MAVTTKQNIPKKDGAEWVAYAVKSGETMHQGTYGLQVDDGYLYEADAGSIAATPKVSGIIADDSANSDGAAPTTADGSFSGSYEESSEIAGDKTVRKMYIGGVFEVAVPSSTIANMGDEVYIADNFTLSLVATAHYPLGRIVRWISATKVWVRLGNVNIGGAVA